MDELLSGLRAAAESTRVRILFILAHGEANVSELTQILGQSQPRVSRHLKLLCDAGLIERAKEGAWVFYRLAEGGGGRELAQKLSEVFPRNDAILRRDLERLDEVRRQRHEEAQSYFAANAAEWDRIRALHVEEEKVERVVLDFVGPDAIGSYLDLGTGTGRILELVAPQAARAVGVDVNNEMLGIARARIEQAGLMHAQVRRADLFQLPFADDSFSVITLHQVLHYLEDPSAAVAEAARVLQPGGKVVIVDFAPHQLEFLRDEHQHRRLGFADREVAQWCRAAGLSLSSTRALPPDDENGLTVVVWLAVLPALPQRRHKPAEAA